MVPIACRGRCATLLPCGEQGNTTDPGPSVTESSIKAEALEAVGLSEQDAPD